MEITTEVVTAIIGKLYLELAMTQARLEQVEKERLSYFEKIAAKEECPRDKAARLEREKELKDGSKTS